MTIRDVAQRSGYSVGTVSRVLNGSPGVSAAAREKVLAVVEELGFSPNSNARQLKLREGRSYSIIVKGVGNRLFAGIVEKMQSLFKDAGRAVGIYYLDEDDDEVELAVRVCRERKPLGILFLGGNRKNFVRGFAAVTCPCVLVTTRADTLGFPNLSSVSTDDVAGAAQAMGHLLDQSPDLTAILAMSDIMAIGALRAIRDRGLRVPEDISIVGYDGIEQAAYCIPRLTTIRQNADRLARRGVDILLQQTDGGNAVHEIVPFQLICGENVRTVDQ